jgi:hypothetical protein
MNLLPSDPKSANHYARTLVSSTPIVLLFLVQNPDYEKPNFAKKQEPR